jgi:hypothetical protein
VQSIGARLYSIIASILFLASLLLRLGVLYFGISQNYNWLFYVISGIAGFFVVAESFMHKGIALNFKTNYHMNLFSYLCSIGFFISFVGQCVQLYQYLSTTSHKRISQIAPIALICVFAIISCVYFLVVGLSFSNSQYDFRKFKIIHIAPMVWAGCSILSVLTNVFSIKNDVNDIIKCVALIFALCFFYCFAIEAENKSTAKKPTLAFLGLFSYVGILLFFDRVLILATKNAVFDSDFVLSISIFLFSLFAYFLKKSIPTGDSLISNEV